jgi:methyl-accepting chemotaxis protein
MASDKARDAVQKSITQVNKALYILAGIGVLVLVLSIFMIAYLNKTIAVPLRQITRAASKIAEGDIETELLPENRKDEVGMLCQSFNSMTASLRNLSKVSEQAAEGDLTVSIKPRSKRDVLAYSFGIMNENLRGLVKEIKDGVVGLDESTAGIIKAMRDVYTDMGESAASRQLQVAAEKLEELAKRLSMIVSQIKV